MATRERTTKRVRAKGKGVAERAERVDSTVEVVERARTERPALPPTLSPAALYRAEKARRSAQLPTTTALEEARREFEQMLKESRPAGTGGRPKKKPAAAVEEPEIDELDESEDLPPVEPEETEEL
jgi:hypothetical protein